MRLRSGYENRKARFELLPLMDVMFLLLVFFIYAMLSMVLHRGIDVALPGAASAVLDKRAYVAVTITADNRVLVDGGEASPDAAIRRAVDLANSGAGAVPKAVFIEGDRKADLGLAIRILDGLRQRGVKEVSFSCSEKDL